MMVRVMTVLALSMMVAAPAMAQDAAPPAAPPAEAPPPAPAAAPAPMPAPSGGGAFGSVGQMVFSVDLPMNNEVPELGILHSSTSMGGGSSTTVNVQPSLDYFVAPNVSVGGQVGIQYSTTSPAGGGSSIGVTVIQVEARVGYNLSIGDTASFWPHVGLAYAHVSSSSGGQSISGYEVPLVVFAPLLWHPASHFFLGAGPVLTTDLTNKVESVSQPKTTSYGVQALLGGYFGG